MTNGLAGTGELARLALRRDRIMVPAWLAVFVFSAASSAAATVKLYPTVGSRVDAATGFNSTTALLALYGRVYDPSSLGALATWKLSAFGAAMVGVLAVIIVVRHTRAEEESGRLELVASASVGRFAALTAALVMGAATAVALGVLTSVALIAAGLSVPGSVAFGLAWTAAGVCFGAVAAVCAQLSVSARTATGGAMAVLGAAYLLRAVGDTSTGLHWLSWLSPLGAGQQLRPYAGERWWVLGLPVVFAAAAVAVAYALAAGRDLGAGVLPDRPGPPGSRTLRSALSLSWRLQRGSLAVWMAAFVVLGAVLGSIAANVGGLLTSQASQDFITELGGRKGLVDAFLATEMGFLGVFGAVYGVQATLRLRADESAQRAEAVLATAVGRVRYALSYFVVALAGMVALLIAGGLVAGTSAAVSTHDSAEIEAMLGAAAVQLPAAWIVAGIAMAAVGFAPRLTVLSWAALAGFVLLGELGPVLHLDQWLMDLSPFGHTPRLPGAPISMVPLVWLLVLATGLTGAGLAGFRRRDITT